MFLADYSHDHRIGNGGGHAHEGEDIEVVGAISPGDRVVIRGNERLQAGQSVSIMDN